MFWMVTTNVKSLMITFFREIKNENDVIRF